jgi:hypothetical protein
MKKINVTFSIPQETNNLLHSLISRRKMSKFVADVLHKALTEKKEALKKAYAEAEHDEDRRATLGDWQELDTGGWE